LPIDKPGRSLYTGAGSIVATEVTQGQLKTYFKNKGWIGSAEQEAVVKNSPIFPEAVQAMAGPGGRTGG
jgi:hypothetical protein